MHDELFNYGPCISRLEKPKFPKNKDVTAINICNGRTDSFVAKHLRSKKCQPCSGSDEAVKRKMFGSMKTARRAMRLGDVKTDRDKATSYFSLRIGKLKTRATEENKIQGLFSQFKNHNKCVRKFVST